MAVFVHRAVGDGKGRRIRNADDLRRQRYGIAFQIVLNGRVGDLHPIGVRAIRAGRNHLRVFDLVFAVVHFQTGVALFRAAKLRPRRRIRRQVRHITHRQRTILLVGQRDLRRFVICCGRNHNRYRFCFRKAGRTEELFAYQRDRLVFGIHSIVLTDLERRFIFAGLARYLNRAHALLIKAEIAERQHRILRSVVAGLIGFQRRRAHVGQADADAGQTSYTHDKRCIVAAVIAVGEMLLHRVKRYGQLVYIFRIGRRQRDALRGIPAAEGESGCLRILRRHIYEGHIGRKRLLTGDTRVFRAAIGDALKLCAAVGLVVNAHVELAAAQRQLCGKTVARNRAVQQLFAVDGDGFGFGVIGQAVADGQCHHVRTIPLCQINIRSTALEVINRNGNIFIPVVGFVRIPVDGEHVLRRGELDLHGDFVAINKRRTVNAVVVLVASAQIVQCIAHSNGIARAHLAFLHTP